MVSTFQTSVGPDVCTFDDPVLSPYRGKVFFSHKQRVAMSLMPTFDAVSWP